MTAKQIDDYIVKCPYFGGANCIDRKFIEGEAVHIGSCALEFHYRKICPSEKCHCAKMFGLVKGGSEALK